MDEFKTALHAFIRQETVLDELIHVLDRVLEQAHDQSEDILSLLANLSKANKLRYEDYSVLKSKIEHFEDITKYAPSARAPGEATASDYPLSQPYRTHRVQSQPKKNKGSEGTGTLLVHPESWQDSEDSVSDYPISRSYSHRQSQSRKGSKGTPSPSHHPSPRNENKEYVLEAGVVIDNKYRLEKILGKGGMGVVWKAVNLTWEKVNLREPYVAIKFLSTDFEQHPDAPEVLAHEFARHDKLLSHNPNIVKVYELSCAGNTIFMVMEFIKGISLKKFIQRHPDGIPLEEAKPIIKDMGNALAYAHQKGLVHSDFKPGNIFYDENEPISKVIDFGIARYHDPSQRDKTRYDPGRLRALTDVYASYEMLVESEEHSPDQRDDIYALACVTYQLLSGKHPFDKRNAVKALDKKLSPKPIKSLKRKQNQALLHGLAFKQEKRTPTVEKFLDELFRKSFFWF